ncbi:MAG TPA: 5'/3'-nucleotidase SurE [Pilimelia sp.]|nr:5'/3'-nucleotidase SurE [Pilimelia sp.]
MSEQLRVLITNDDGIASPGIRALALAVVEAGYDVVVAAPLEEASGTSASLTATERDGRVVVEGRDLAGLPGTPAFAVSASPGFIALLATRGAFGAPPDLILSGINRGANAGHAILHSGTVGAALTASANGCHAMAVSLDVLTAAAATAGSGGAAIAYLDKVDDESRNWNTAAAIAVDLLPSLCEAPNDIVFNINTPDRPRDQVHGVRLASMARFGQVQIAVAEVGQGFVRTSLEEPGGQLEEGTDLAWLRDGYAAVTPLRGVSEVPDVAILGKNLDLSGVRRA